MKPQIAAAPRSVELSIPPGHLLAPEAPIAFAPDGSAIVFGLTDPAMGVQLWLRRMDRFDTIPLEGTVGATHPFWSPDSKSIAFFVNTDASLRRIDLASSTTQIICKNIPFGRGGAWGTDGTILFTRDYNSPIQRVRATGGEPVMLQSWIHRFWMAHTGFQSFCLMGSTFFLLFGAIIRRLQQGLEASMLLLSKPAL